MTKSDVSKIKHLLSKPKQIVIIPHKNPDGDALGSTLALYHYLNLSNHNVIVISPNDYPVFLKWLPGENKIINHEIETVRANDLITSADIVFTLDFNALHRAGDLGPIIRKANGLKILIDHHQQPDDFAHYLYSDVTMSSTCEMVYNFIEMLEDISLITAHIATCLYTGIMTDTGSFKFPLTTDLTHKVVSELIKKGANGNQINNLVYDNNSCDKLLLLSHSLSNMVVDMQHKTAYMYLTQQNLNKYNFKKGDTEGFVNYGLSIKGIKFAAIFIENEAEKIIKISFRSKGDFNVNEFSRNNFNGGGHINAAGGYSKENLEATLLKFKNLLPDYKTKLNE